MGVLELLFQDKKTTWNTITWIVLGTLLLIYFILAAAFSVESGKKLSYKIWYATDPDIIFPQFVICPLAADDWIWHSLCYLHDSQSHQSTPLNFDMVYPNPPTHSCFRYIPNQKFNVNTQSIVCEFNITQSELAKVQVFFVEPNTADFSNCENCLLGQNNYILSNGSFCSVGIEKSVFYFDAENRNKIFEYRAYGMTYPPNVPIGSHIRTEFFFLSDRVWYYEKYDYFNFYQFVGAIGGACFLAKLLHKVVTIIAAPLWKGERRRETVDGVSNSVSNTEGHKNYNSL